MKRKFCPRCKENPIPRFPALSRRDNKTEICPSCGMQEAFEDSRLIPKWQDKPYWRTQRELPQSGNE